MNAKFEQYCLGKLGAIEDYPFGPGVVTFKIGGKLFAIASPPGNPTTMSLKCNPERAVVLRQQYTAITPGYHLNKQHWNTVTLDGSLPDEVVMSLIDHSYVLVAPRPKRVLNERNLRPDAD